MKPTHNRIYCISCRRPKMLFESKEKADNFIKFNSDEMVSETGKAPVRSYYCALCCGWHVTSNRSAVRGEIMDERDSELISWLESQKKAKAIHEATPAKKEKQPKAAFPEYIQLCTTVETVKHMMRRGETEKAESAIEDIRGAALELDQVVLPQEKREDVLERVLGCEQVLQQYREVIEDSGTVSEIMAGTPGTKWNALLKAMVKRREYKREMEEGFACIESLTAEGLIWEAEAVAAALLKRIPRTKTIYNAKERSAWENRLTELTKSFHPEKAYRDKLLMAISKAEMAAKAASEGLVGTCYSYIEDARLMLSKIENCPEKESIQAFLDNLEEKL